MTPEKQLANAPEKYRDTAKALHAFISKRLGKKQLVTVSDHGIIGYGTGTDGFVLTGMAVRSAGVVLYTSADLLTKHAKILGKKRTGKTCLRLRKFEDVPEKVLNDVVRQALKRKQMDYGPC